MLTQGSEILFWQICACEWLSRVAPPIEWPTRSSKLRDQGSTCGAIGDASACADSGYGYTGRRWCAAGGGTAEVAAGCEPPCRFRPGYSAALGRSLQPLPR